MRVALGSPVSTVLLIAQMDCATAKYHMYVRNKNKMEEKGEKQQTLDITKRSILNYTKCKNSYPED